MPHLTQEEGTQLIVEDEELLPAPGWVDAPGSYVFRIGRVVMATLNLEEDETVPVWDEGTTYAKGALARDAEQNYLSKTDGNKGHKPKDEEEANWEQAKLACTLPAPYRPVVDLQYVKADGRVLHNQGGKFNGVYPAGTTSP